MDTTDPKSNQISFKKVDFENMGTKIITSSKIKKKIKPEKNKLHVEPLPC